MGVPPCPAFSVLFCPLSPQPPSPVGKGEPQRLFCRGLRPRHPCTEPPAALTVPSMRAPRARSLRCGAKSAETLSYEQCRQPRRGGTGGEELRRLRWSSPPGQGEQVPLGFIPPPSTTATRSAGDQKSQPPSGYPQGRFTRQPPPCAPQKSKRVPGAIPPRTPKNHCRYVSSP